MKIAKYYEGQEINPASETRRRIAYKQAKAYQGIVTENDRQQADIEKHKENALREAKIRPYVDTGIKLAEAIALSSNPITRIPMGLYWTGEAAIEHFGPDGKQRTEELKRGIDRRNGDPVINYAIENGLVNYEDLNPSYQQKMQQLAANSEFGDELNKGFMLMPFIKRLKPIMRMQPKILFNQSKSIEGTRALPAYIEDAVIVKAHGGKLNYLNYL